MDKRVKHSRHTYGKGFSKSTKKGNKHRPQLEKDTLERIQYTINPSYPKSVGMVRSYILSARMAERSETYHSKIESLNIESIKFTSDDKEIMKKMDRLKEDMDKSKSHSPVFSPLTSNLTIIYTSEWDSAFLTTFASVKAGNDRGVSIVVAGGSQFGGFGGILHQIISSEPPKRLPTGRGSQEEALCQTTNYAMAALRSRTKHEQEMQVNDAQYVKPGPDLETLGYFSRSHGQAVSNIRPIITEEILDEWRHLKRRNSREFFSGFLADKQKEFEKKHQQDQIYNISQTDNITAYQVIGPKFDGNERKITSQHKELVQIHRSVFRHMMERSYHQRGVKKPDIIIAPPLSTYAFAQDPKKKKDPENPEASINVAFREKMIEAHLKALVLETEYNRNQGRTGRPPRIIIPVSPQEQLIYQSYCDAYGITVEEFEFEKMLNSQTSSNHVDQDLSKSRSRKRTYSSDSDSDSHLKSPTKYKRIKETTPEPSTSSWFE